MKTNFRALIVLAALLGSALACNLPSDSVQIFPTQEGTPANSTLPAQPPFTPAATQPAATLAATQPPNATPPPTVTAVLPQPSEPPDTPTPSQTPAGPTSTPPPTITSGPTATLTRSPVPSATFTATRSLTPSQTPTRTLTPVPGTRTATNTPPPTVTPVKTQPATATPVNTLAPSATSAASGRQVSVASYFSIPPVLDGIWDEWHERSTEYPARSLVYGGNEWVGADDLEASYRVAWDANYLYLAMKVKDDVYAQNASGSELYLGDSLELLLDTNLQGDLADRALSADDFQLGFSGGLGDVNGVKEAYLWFPRDRAGSQGGVTIAAVRQGGVTRIEAAIPWSVFGVTPAAGQRYGFAISASDNDDTGRNVQQSMVSSTPGRVLVDPTTWGELQLK